MATQERPAFEVLRPDGTGFKIYADGRTVGFPKDATIIINRLPQIIRAANAEK